MKKQQRYKHEMFVRVRDYGMAHAALFPESSTGSQTFARVTAAVAAIDDHLKNRVVARADARKVKATTRAAVLDGMKTLALTARRVTRPEPGTSPFRMPKRRTVKVEIATARAFIAEAEKRHEQFVRFGLPSTFVSDFGALVDDLQRAVDVRLSSRTGRRQAQAGIETALAEGLEAVRDLDAIVAIATRQDPVVYAAWQTARHIEGQRSGSSVTEEEPVPAVEATAPTVAAAPTNAGAKAPDPALVLGRAS
jgi:peptidyl-tRNA hydrolase